jgi:pilus assembly protein CpaD
MTGFQYPASSEYLIKVEKSAMSSVHFSRGALVLRSGAIAVLCGLLLGACARDKSTTGSITYPDDTRERHPIVLRNAVTTLDVFTPGNRSGLDERQKEDIAAFASDYRRTGRGQLMVQVPSDGHGSHGANAVRQSLASAGVPSGAVRFSAYPAADPRLAAPVRMSFAKMKAEVPHECGQWPSDLGGSDIRQSASNQSYWNLGCASQAMLAAQVADPIDLVRPRQETPLDTTKRMESIKKFRQGQDPSTQYRQEATKINTAVGGGT